MANINAVWSNGNNWRLSTAANLVWTPQVAEPVPAIVATPSGVCCPGPASKALAWTPCLAAEPMTAITGFVGLTTRTRGERCATARVTWTTNRWTHSTWPSIGDTAQINGSSYFVDSSVYQDCIVVLQLCKPILECPDCLSQIRRLLRLPGNCPDPLISTIVAADVPTKVCVHDQIRRIVDGAEIQIISAQICLDTTADVQVGDLVFCNDEVWRIDRIESPCSSVCLLTLQAIKEPWNIAQPPGAEVYLGYAPLILPGVDVDAVGNLPNVYLAAGNFVLAGLQLEAEGETPGATVYGGLEQDISGLQVTIEAEYHSVYISDPASVTLSGLQADAEGVAVDQDVYVAHLDEVVSGFQAVGEGTYTEVYTGTADLTIAGLQHSAEGDYLSVYISDAAVVDLSGLLAVTGGVWSEVETPFGQLDQDIPGFQASGEGTYLEVYIGVFSGEGCGPWTTDLDEIVTDDLDDPIIFSDPPCPIELPGLQASLSGEYTEPAIPPVFGELTEDISGLQFFASTSYTPPPPQEGSLNEFISGLQFAATTFYADPIPPEDQIGSLNEFISGLQFAATTTYTPPPPPPVEEGELNEAISGLQFAATTSYTDPQPPVNWLTPTYLGGYVSDPTQSYFFVYPDENINSGVSPTTTMLVVLEPVQLEQGQTVETAQIYLQGTAGGDIPPGQYVGNVRAWAVDNALPHGSTPAWTLNDMNALPRTTASVPLAFQFNPMFAVQVQYFDQYLELTPVINEIVSRPGWVKGNRILLIFDPDTAQSIGDTGASLYGNDSFGIGGCHFEVGEITPVTQVPYWMEDGTDEYLDLITADGRQKLGIGYDSITTNTVFDIGANYIDVTNDAELQSAIATAKVNTNIRAIRLAMGTYHWPMINATTSYLSGFSRDISVNHPLVFMTKPGEAAQAKLEGPGGDKIVEQKVLRGVAFVDLDMRTGIQLLGYQGISDILIERCRVWIECRGGTNNTLTIPGTTLALPTLPTENILIRLNSICDHFATSSSLVHGIYGYHNKTMLIEGNIIDHNGWGPTMTRNTLPSAGGPSIFKHNIYLNPYYVPDNQTGDTRGVEVRYNLISRASSHGAHMKTGGNVYRNLFVRNPITCQQGYGDDQFFTAYGLRVDMVFRDNVTIGADDINVANGDLRGIGWINTCSENSQFIRNAFIDDRTSISNSEIYRLECDYPINSLNMEHNRAASWPVGTPIRQTPCVPGSPDIQTDLDNDWTKAVSGAQTLSDFYHADFQIELMKVPRWRFGVDIYKIQREMTLVRGVLGVPG